MCKLTARRRRKKIVEKSEEIDGAIDVILSPPSHHFNFNISFALSLPRRPDRPFVRTNCYNRRPLLKRKKSEESLTDCSHIKRNVAEKSQPINHSREEKEERVDVRSEGGGTGSREARCVHESLLSMRCPGETNRLIV